MTITYKIVILKSNTEMRICECEGVEKFRR